MKPIYGRFKTMVESMFAGGLTSSTEEPKHEKHQLIDAPDSDLPDHKLTIPKGFTVRKLTPPVKAPKTKPLATGGFVTTRDDVVPQLRVNMSGVTQEAQTTLANWFLSHHRDQGNLQINQLEPGIVNVRYDTMVFDRGSGRQTRMTYYYAGTAIMSQTFDFEWAMGNNSLTLNGLEGYVRITIAS